MLPGLKFLAANIFILAALSLSVASAQEASAESLREAHILLSAAAKSIATQSIEKNVPAAETELYAQLIKTPELADAANFLAKYVDAVKNHMSPTLIGGTIMYGLTYNIHQDIFISVGPKLALACNDKPAGEDMKCIAKFFAENGKENRP